eukprot:CAMPEP_0115359966 /NCGR_PEP_ID=MMETSP0270-20121206/101443_1 /TAXON_ID=71861 /ORGANISM="Scrippsiella trochoidea, Strain CCMP3099" /LENGTH=57 /DNA_ID=CAMNT_0002782485 /DNA_START=9 /DNA_END=179 /DNA_ORIENTATION=+
MAPSRALIDRISHIESLLGLPEDKSVQDPSAHGRLSSEAKARDASYTSMLDRLDCLA